MVLGRQVRCMSQEAKFQETLRKLAMVHEGFVQDKARLGLNLTKTWVLDHKMAALLVLGVTVAIGSSSFCLQWSVSRALAAGVSQEEITDVLLVIAPVAGLGRWSAPLPTWRPRSGTTSRPHCITRTIHDGGQAPRTDTPEAPQQPSARSSCAWTGRP
jgi:alkylhydroperoxidase/carboxymuconolactone decarboxylase family protein YurZ